MCVCVFSLCWIASCAGLRHADCGAELLTIDGDTVPTMIGKFLAAKTSGVDKTLWAQVTDYPCSPEQKCCNDAAPDER